MTCLGIIGAGHLADYLCQGLRRADWDGQILVSPHNKNKADLFVESFGAKVGESGQAVVDDADIVLLSIRPDQCGMAMREIEWPSGKLVLSAMAGVSIATMAKLAPGTTIVRAMPVSSAAINQSPTTLYPANQTAQELLTYVGSVIVMADENTFNVASANGAVYGWCVALIEQLVIANENVGLSREAAVEVVAKTLSSAANVAGAPGTDVRGLLRDLSTPGGITAQGIAVLMENEAFAPWHDAFNAVAKRLNT